MASIAQRSLFSWREIDASSDLARLDLVLDALPDEALVRALERQRGKGRDDYPIRPMWNALLAGVVFQHQSAASLLRELRRNAELRERCGFDPWRGADAAPSEDAFGRFLALVMERGDEIRALFDQLLDELAEELPDLGRRLAVDSKAIPSAGKPVKDEAKLADPDGRRDLDADWGVKTYRGQHADGRAWEKVVKWFGYKLHLLVDTTHELPLAFAVTPASTADSPALLPLVEDWKERHPDLAEGRRELAADKGYDATENHRELYDEHGIAAVIPTRHCWKEEETKPLFPDRFDYVIYDEDGRVQCVCPQTGETRDLFFAGFEKERNALKYRCPAAAYGFICQGRAACEKGHRVGAFGRVFRAPLELDRRVFTPLCRTTRKWETAYRRRTAVERVNSRLDRVFGFEQHFIRGQAKMEMRVGLALVVLLAMALGRIRADQRDRLRSLTAPPPRRAA
jgi:hypothetical protein